jgi:hypothetical protein
MWISSIIFFSKNPRKNRLTSKEQSMTVQSGCCVKMEMLYRSGNREHITLDIVPDEKADYENGFIGISTPLAKALIGEKSGYFIPYFTQELKAIQIISIKKSSRTPETNKSSTRTESIKEMVKKIEFRDAVLFASSTETKWGSYDTDGLDYSKWKSGRANTDQ